MPNDLTVYNQYAAQMDTGDSLLYVGNSYVGSLIGWWVKAFFKDHGDPLFSHGNMVLCFHEYELRKALRLPMLDKLTVDLSPKRWVLDARASGVYPVLLSDYLASYDGEVYWYPLRRTVDQPVRQAIGKYAMGIAGAGYDFLGLFKNAVVLVSPSMKNYFCSESIFMSYRDGGHIVTGDVVPRPDMIPALNVFEKPVRII